MAVTATPVCAQGVLASSMVHLVTNTAIDGTGSFSTPVGGGGNGGLIECIIFKAYGTTTANGVLRIWRNDSADGTTGTNYLLDEILMPGGVTPSSTVKSERTVWTPDGGAPLRMPLVGASGISWIKFTTHQADLWTAFVIGQGY